jgi:hypothetical protein
MLQVVLLLLLWVFVLVFFELLRCIDSHGNELCPCNFDVYGYFPQIVGHDVGYLVVKNKYYDVGDICPLRKVIKRLILKRKEKKKTQIPCFNIFSDFNSC